jgi:hypothetical protein
MKSKVQLGVGMFFFALVSSVPAQAATTFYVATTGSDTAAGTEAAPFATVGKAQTSAAAGDTVLIRGGTFAFTGSGTVGVAFSKSGTASAPINYFAYPGEVPVFDLSNLTPSNRVTGLDVHCNYIHIRGLEVMGVHQYQSGQDSWGVRIQGSNNVLENLNVHNNDAPGVFITSGANNLVLNCDSHDNYDVLESGGSGDGFGCHSSGGGNILRGCRAYNNSDDGYDFINAAGSCTVEESFSFKNGWVPGTSTAAGNGAGFKAGGYGSPPSTPSTGAATHTVQRCVAFSNRAQGFYANHHPGRINFYNNTAYNNPANFNMLADSGYPSDHVIRNNIAFGTGGTISNLTGGTATFNSWNLSVTVSTADFASVDTATVLAARAADGGLPNISFVHLVAGSDLIDVGTDVGLPFVGAAPDLGAFEYGATTTATGGTSGAGSGGAAGTGGKTGGTGGAGSAGTGGGTGGAGNGGNTGAGGTRTGGISGGGGGVGSSGATGGANGANTGGSGGAASTGGSAGTGGLGAGGITGAGGAKSGGSSGAGSGGSTASANTGGSSGSGGIADTGGVGAGGSGGQAAASGGAAGSSANGTAKSGCSCRIGERSDGRTAYALVSWLLVAACLRRRRPSSIIGSMTRR